LLDLERQKRFDWNSAQRFIDEHSGDFTRFLNDIARKEDHFKVGYNMRKKGPALLAYILSLNYTDVSSNEERYEKAFTIIAEEGMFSILVGAKRHGKTAAAIVLMEWCVENGYDVYWYGYYPKMKEIYPEFKQTLNLKKIENAVAIVDEAIIMWFGREAMTRELKNRVKGLPTAGHRGLSIVFLSQTFQIDPTIRLLADSIWFKPLFTFEFFQQGLKINPVVKYALPKNKKQNLLLNLHTEEAYMFENELPKRWCEELSKPFALIKDEGKAREFFEECVSVFSQREAVTMLEQRGWSVDELYPPIEDDVDLSPTARVKAGTQVEAKTPTKQLRTPSSGKRIDLNRCPKCGSMDFVVHGRYKNKTRYRCQSCWKTWSK
jgi:hypothetical protein